MSSRIVAVVVALALLTACDGDPITRSVGDGGPAERLAERIEVVGAHVESWEQAVTVDEAWAAAEAAANHVVGPTGPGFGDRDADGEVRDPSDAGILPGMEGDPPGFALLAAEAGAPSCVTEDVLGGTWAEPEARWGEMAEAIEAWSPSDNTMARLASHPQRIVGWATLALRSDDLDHIQELAGHARLHVDASRRALECRS
jgi:hypothetical protein